MGVLLKMYVTALFDDDNHFNSIFCYMVSVYSKYTDFNISGVSTGYNLTVYLKQCMVLLYYSISALFFLTFSLWYLPVEK